jgi:hypothetical protein
MPKAARLITTTVVFAVLSLLEACGGGGSDAVAPAAQSSIDTGCFVTSTVAPITPAAPFVTGIGSVVVNGTALFASVPNNNSNGALNYAVPVNKPVRGATVQALDASGTVLASAATSDTGSYALSVPSNTTFTLRLRAELMKATGPANWSVAVRDNTSGNALWTLDSAAVFSGTTSLQKSLTAASGWNGSSYNATTTPGNPRAAGPFAILDTIYDSMKLVTTAQATTQFPPLTVFWSPNNQPASGDRSLGEISGTFFTTTGTCTDLQRAIYVLGKENVDTDEYDSGVVAHEYGHYLQSAFSTNHSLGGQHGSNDKLDMTLAFSEAWGNAFSSMARGNPIYADSSGSEQTLGFTINMATLPGATAASRGWYSEGSLNASLYNLFTGQGFAPIWAALTGPMKTSQDAVASVFSFAEAVRGLSASVGNALNALLATQNIFTGSTANQWGQGETNNGGNAGNLPVYTTLALGVGVPSCFTGVNLRGTSINKLGTTKYYRVTLPSSGVRTITVNFPTGGHDIDFEVFQKGVLRGQALSDNPTTEFGSLNLAAGEVVIRALDFNAATASVATADCATIRID